MVVVVVGEILVIVMRPSDKYNYNVSYSSDIGGDSVNIGCIGDNVDRSAVAIVSMV